VGAGATVSDGRLRRTRFDLSVVDVVGAAQFLESVDRGAGPLADARGDRLVATGHVTGGVDPVDKRRLPLVDDRVALDGDTERLREVGAAGGAQRDEDAIDGDPVALSGDDGFEGIVTRQTVEPVRPDGNPRYLDALPEVATGLERRPVRENPHVVGRSSNITPSTLHSSSVVATR